MAENYRRALTEEEMPLAFKNVYGDRTKKPISVQIAEVGMDFTPLGLGESVNEIKEELQKENPNYYKIGTIGGLEAIGLIPGLDKLAVDAIKSGAKKFGLKKVSSQIDTLLKKPKPEDVVKTELFGGVSMEGAAKDKNLKKAIKTLKDSDFYKFNMPASETGGISYDLNKQIWNDTGWYVDPADGQWRYFIDDTKASLKNLDEISNIEISPDARNPSIFKNVKMSDVFDHPEFYKRYPKFKDLKITFYNADRKNPKNVNLLGSYDETRNSLKINMGAATHMSMVDGKFVTNPDALKKTLLHELQHVIQRKENFVRGASADDIPPDLVYDKDRELRGKKKPIQKKFDEIKSEFDLTDFTLKMQQDEVRNNPLPGLTIQQEIEIYNKHYSQPDKLRPDVTWASTAKEYGVPVSRVQKAAGRTNTIALLNKKRAEQGKVYNKLADEVYDVDRERSRIETNFYEGAGGEIEARLTEDMLDNPDMFPIDARAGMLEKEGNLYEYQGKYGVDPFNYEVQPRKEPESTNLVDTVKKKFGIIDNVKPLTLQQQKSLSPDLKILFDEDNTQAFKNILVDDTFAREVLAEYRSPTRDITGDPASLKDVQSVRKELYDLTQQSLKDLPEEITVYRYGPLNESDGLSSFTLNPNFGTLSLPWAQQRNYPLESYTVKKSEILAAPDLIRTFDEAEVIIRNNAVKKEPRQFAEGGDTVRPEPKPKTRPFPDVKPKARPDLDEYRGRTYDIYSVEIDGRETNVIEFKDGKRMSVPQIRQMFEEHKSASESIPGKQTSQEISKFLEDNNPTYDEFVRHFTAKRLNKGGEVGEQMQMAFMNEGGLTDDGMNTDPVSGNDIPSGSMAEEVRDDIPAQLSEGEYVVPADVVRYYGVKFFEDLRDRAKRGLAEMEANGRIGGEPVPEGGPINNEELSPEEMQAIQEMMGMSEGGQVRGYQDSSLVTGSQVESNMLGGQSPAQVEQQILSAGSAARAENYIGSPLGFSIFGDSSPTTQQTSQQPQTSTFTPIVLYNKAGQSKAVNSEEEKIKAEADGYTMTLEQYNMYRSQSGGSGSGGSTITPPGGEDGEPKPWGQDLKNWNDVDDIKQFVAQAERGNLSGSGRFLRGAGFAIAGLPGAMLAGAFQSFKGLNSLYDMEAAQIIAEAKGKAGSKEHADLAVEIQKGIDTYLEKAGGIVNFAYKPGSKNVMNKVNGVFVGTGYDNLDSWAAGTRRTTIADFAATTTKSGKSTKASQNILDKRKGSGMGKSTVKSTRDGPTGTRSYTSGAKSVRSETGADTSAAGMKAAKESLKGRKINIGGRNKGGLMTKGKKKK